jgi:hypothetical protein
MLYNSILRQTPPYTFSVFRDRQALQQLVVPGLFASPFSGFLPFSCHTWFCHYSATLPLCLCSLSASAVRCLPNITLSFTLIFFSLSLFSFLFDRLAEHCCLQLCAVGDEPKSLTLILFSFSVFLFASVLDTNNSNTKKKNISASANLGLALTPCQASCATSCPAHGQHRSSHCPRFRCWTFYLLTLSLHFVLSHGCTYAVPVRSLYSLSAATVCCTLLPAVPEFSLLAVPTLYQLSLSSVLCTLYSVFSLCVLYYARTLTLSLYFHSSLFLPLSFFFFSFLFF